MIDSYQTKQMTKNLHISHPEDSILTGNLEVLDWFVTPGHLSTKIDGSPAIVFGTNPANGKWCVCTKSAFNKVKIKLCHSHEEIDQFYTDKVADILHLCFDYLPRTETIYQGDFIGECGSDEYTPNTITYKFPEVITQNIIISLHTCYYAENDLRDAVAMPDLAIWKDTDTVKFVKPTASIFAGAEYFADVEEVCKFARQMSTAVKFVTDKGAARIKKELNARIRAGMSIHEDDFECDPNLIRLWLLVKTIKEDCLFLCRCTGPQAYLNGECIVGEGFVMVNEFGMYKLINREVFSHANFNSGRFQVV
jgi:hypothetical protein